MHVITDEDDRMTLELGESLARPGKRAATVTPHRWERLPQLRRALIEVARQRRTTTYSEASAAADGIAPQQSMGEVLDLIALDCYRRGEPNLAALVVGKATSEVGDGFGDGAEGERSACFDWWAADSLRRPQDEAETATREQQLRRVGVRLGQQQFRDSLLAAYSGACAVTGCSVLGVLQAAHIDPYDGPATNVVINGLLLRADLHNLFDFGLLWVTDDLCVAVDRQLGATEYGELHGRPLRLPAIVADHPDRKRLGAHRHRFGRRDRV